MGKLRGRSWWQSGRGPAGIALGAAGVVLCLWGLRALHFQFAAEAITDEIRQQPWRETARSAPPTERHFLEWDSYGLVRLALGIAAIRSGMRLAPGHSRARRSVDPTTPQTSRLPIKLFIVLSLTIVFVPIVYGWPRGAPPYAGREDLAAFSALENRAFQLNHMDVNYSGPLRGPAIRFWNKSWHAS